MKIIDSIEELHIEEATAVAIGKFDGIHLGHRALLEEILNGKKVGLKSAIFTFYPSPAAVFSENGKFQSLSTRKEKRLYLEEAGIDYLVEYPLNLTTASIEPAEFIRIFLKERMHAGLVAAGPDLSFGKQGKGNFALLKRCEEEYGYKAVQIDKVCMDGKEISSTRIRDAVERGDLAEAEKCLGVRYSISGIVAHGTEIGRSMGFPTLNLLPDQEKLLPPFGVYHSLVRMEGKYYAGVTNIGRKPTVQNDGEVTVETFLLDYDDTVYDQTVSVELIEFVRPERKFGGRDQLAEQIEADVSRARGFFGNFK